MRALTMTTPHFTKKALALMAAGLLAAWCLGAGATQPGAAAPQHDAPPGAHAPQANARTWTPGTLRQALSSLPKGDPTRGLKVHEELFCASCHGARGVAPTQNWPHLAGQRAAYTAKMLLDYQSGLRQEGKRAGLMQDIAVLMTTQQIADVSAFYALQPVARNDGTPRPAPLAAARDMDAAHLVRKGDPARLLTPCASCHGVAGQGGNREASALAGQNPLYFVRTLLDYQTGVRANDSARGMRSFAQKLSRTEIEALATYYADLPAGKTAKP